MDIAVVVVDAVISFPCQPTVLLFNRRRRILIAIWHFQ